MSSTVTNSGTSTTVFGLTHVRTEALAAELLQSFSYNSTSDRYEVKDHLGRVIDVFYFNHAKSGEFEIFRRAAGTFATDTTPGAHIVITVSGTATTVQCTETGVKPMPNECERVTIRWEYHPDVVLD